MQRDTLRGIYTVSISYSLLLAFVLFQYEQDIVEISGIGMKGIKGDVKLTRFLKR